MVKQDFQDQGDEIISKVIKFDTEDKCGSLYTTECRIEGFLKCSYIARTDDDKTFYVEYRLTENENSTRPLGIKTIILDDHRTIMDEYTVDNKFFTLDESIKAMKLMARYTIFPYTGEELFQE